MCLRHFCHQLANLTSLFRCQFENKTVSLSICILTASIFTRPLFTLNSSIFTRPLFTQNSSIFTRPATKFVPRNNM